MKNSKKKHKGLTPPLSNIDIITYISFLLLSIGISIALIFIALSIQKTIAFKEASVVTYDGAASNWWIAPLFLHIFIPSLALGVSGLQYKIPLFGNNTIRYREHPYKRNIYPLFKRKQYVHTHKAKNKPVYYYLIVAWCIIFIVFACIFPLGICGREVLYEDSTIAIYTATNKLKQSYSLSDIENMTIFTYRSYSRYGADRWCYEITFKMSNGKKVSFDNSFHDGALNEFIEIKDSLDSNQITIKKSYNLDKVIEDNNLSDSESKKLYELFSTP
jgi:hypothetical protein